MEINNKIPFTDVTCITKDILEYATNEKYAIVYIPIKLKTDGYLREYTSVVVCKEDEKDDLKYELLKQEGVQLIVITARGLDGGDRVLQYMEDDAKRILDENNIVFDKYYWKQNDKLEICTKENIDIMIEDDFRIITDLANNKVKTFKTVFVMA